MTPSWLDLERARDAAVDGPLDQQLRVLTRVPAVAVPDDVKRLLRMWIFPRRLRGMRWFTFSAHQSWCQVTFEVPDVGGDGVAAADQVREPVPVAPVESLPTLSVRGV